MRLLLGILPAVMVHFDRGRPRTLRLVCDLDLPFAYLDRRGVVIPGSAVLARSSLFLVGDLGQPLTRAVLLLVMSFGHAHCIVLRKHTLRPIQVPASYGHR